MEDRNTVSHLPSSILHPLSSISSCLSGSSYTTNVQILCRLERILLRGFFALFASSRLIPDSAFSPLRREGRKENAKQIVWLRLGCLCENTNLRGPVSTGGHDFSRALPFPVIFISCGKL